jgi:hypothetical protein
MVRGGRTFDQLLTVIVPTSPIPRHPSTNLIEECLGAIRRYFPTERVIVACDGVRPQIEHRRGQYEEYLRKLPLAINGETELMIMPQFYHQARMTRYVLDHVNTPLVLFVEHDAILRWEPRIEWDAIFNIILQGEANSVRLYNWDKVPWHEHDYLMKGQIVNHGVRFVKTVQFSGWPLVASTDYFKCLLDQVLTPGRYAMIETLAYGPVAGASWEEHKTVIYAPENALTFTHRDGRTDEATGKRDQADW